MIQSWSVPSELSLDCPFLVVSYSHSIASWQNPQPHNIFYGRPQKNATFNTLQHIQHENHLPHQKRAHFLLIQFQCLHNPPSCWEKCLRSCPVLQRFLFGLGALGKWALHIIKVVQWVHLAGVWSRLTVDNCWLVLWTPLKNISQLGWLFPIYGKIENVPNHQPV